MFHLDDTALRALPSVLMRTSNRAELHGLLRCAALGGIITGCGASPAVQRPGQTTTRPPDEPAHASQQTAPDAPQKPDGSDFVAVLSLPHEGQLFAVRDQIVFVADGPLEAGMPIGIIDQDHFIEKPELLFRGGWVGVAGLAGDWPRGIDLLATGSTGRVGIAEHWAFTDAGWVKRTQALGHSFAGVTELSGTVLGLEVSGSPVPVRPILHSLRGPKVVRNFKPIDKICRARLITERSPDFVPPTQVIPETFTATKSGMLFVLGRDACSEVPTLEIWPKGQVNSSLQALPIPPINMFIDSVGIAAGSGDSDVYALYDRVVHVTDQDMALLPALPGPALSLAATDKGVVYVVTGRTEKFVDGNWITVRDPGLFRLDGARWVELALPSPPKQLLRGADNTVWLVAGTTVFRLRRSEQEKSIAVLPAGPPNTGNRAPIKRRSPGPFCPSNVVVLYAFTDKTPDDYDFPLTRKALVGHTEYKGTRFVVARDGGKKYLSALVPDDATGRRLQALIQKEVAGSRPQLVCAEPEILRELAIDLQTGTLKN